MKMMLGRGGVAAGRAGSAKAHRRTRCRRVFIGETELNEW
jgi:hypothetical protein